MENDLPYRVEYAKSGRAKCKGCKGPIDKDTVRVARMVQSGFHDGKDAHWFHEKCFFAKFRPNTIGDIAGFELLRIDDQNRIKQQLDVSSVIVTTGTKTGAGGKKGKKRPLAEGEIQMTAAAVKDFGIEYSSTSRAACKGCEFKIMKGDVRAKKVSFDTEVGMKYGGQPLWHHLECFAKLRTELQWYAAANQLPGFNGLSADDQAKALKLIPSVSAEAITNLKKLKMEPKDEVDAALDKTMIQQNELYHKNRAVLKEKFKKADWHAILNENKQQIPEGIDPSLEAATDTITFGALLPCTNCNGQFVFNKANYICTGNISEWQKCEKTMQEPPRTKATIPKYMIEAEPTLPRKMKVMVRALKYIPPSVSNVQVKKEEPDGPKVVREKPPLYRLEFVILGKVSRPKDDIKNDILKLGGVVGTKIYKKLAGIISTEEDVQKMGSRMQDAEKHGIQILPETFLDCVRETGADAMKLIKTMSLCDWGTDPAVRAPPEDDNKSKSKSIYTKSVPKSITLKLKNGTAVDPDSGLVDTAHVYTKGGQKYFAILSKTDIQRDKNSYYKLQLLESNNNRKYYIFRAWGRIGTRIGSFKLDNYPDLNEAIHQFNRLYKEQTGNHFGTKNFQKKPDLYYPVDVDYGEEQVKKITDNSNIKSNLQPSVQELMKLLFDIDAMKKVMLDFDLDMEKMPLGKLSQKQLNDALKVLNEISELIRTGAENTNLIGKSNHFYSLVPHDFGTERPTVINTTELVNNKTEMIESLMEIELAYGLLQTDQAENISPLDSHYEQLKTDMEPLNHSGEEFKLLEKYVQNTHAATHSNYELEIADIFKVARNGEKRRYKPFKKLHNRQLLWHGSRLTNFVGILSHGLKIAPPEAPATGYMFGKGIYFADMVSKSANYCFTNPSNNTGLMLLCEVALGDMEQFTEAKYVTQLPKNKHSTKGLGKTYPNPQESHFRDDGVEIPLGKSMTDTKMKSSLLYNEFIVYDVAQVNVQYLFKMEFKYKY